MKHVRSSSLTVAAASLALAAALLASGRAQSPPDAASPVRTVVEGAGESSAVDTGRLEDAAPSDARWATRADRSVAFRDLPYVPGKVIVKFREDIEAPAAEIGRREVAHAFRAHRLTRPSYADFDLLYVDDSADVEAIARRLAGRADVEYAQAAYKVRPYFRPNDPFFSRQWNLQLIGMEQAWDINEGGDESVVVAVLDTGVAYQNATVEFYADGFTDGGLTYPPLGRILVPFAAAPDLAAAGRFVSPRDFIYDDASPVDTDGHGTHVASTVGELANNGVGVAGIAFKTRIMPVKCISGAWDDIFGSPFAGTDDVVARAIRYAADNGAKVINLSLGRNGGPPAPAIGDAMRYAVSRGAFLAVAAGNDYENGNPVERLAEQAAPINGAIVVSAVGPDGARAYYSSVQSYVEIAAPGGNRRIGDGFVYQQTYDPRFTDLFLLPPSQYGPPRFDTFAYMGYTGTSMATPHVAGLAALLVSQGITNPAAIEAAIKRFAVDKGTTGRDNEYGDGLIAPRATLRGLGLAR